MTQTITDSLLSVVSRGINVRRFGEGELVGLPFAFSDGHLLTVMVREVTSDLFTLTDRGMTAEALWAHGLDLSASGPLRSWRAFQAHLNLPPPMGYTNEFELAMSSGVDTLGEDILKLAEGMLLGEGLKALVRKRRRGNLGERIVGLAAERHLGVVPRAPMPTRFGHRRPVTAKIVGNSELYVQGVGHSKGQSYDHARSLFADSGIDESARLTVIGNDADIEPWQLQALSEVSRVVPEQSLAATLDELAA